MKSKLTKLFGLTIIIFCLGASSTFVHGDCFPNACGGKGEYCKTPSLEIWRKYCEGTGLDGISIPSVYSGTCFHEAYNRDPFYNHHGVILIDEKTDKRYFGGEFSFFAKKNPYKDLDVEAVRRIMHWFYTEDHEIEWNKDYAWIHLTPEPHYHINYFMRKRLKDDKILFLIGYWKGTSYRIFCELQMNEQSLHGLNPTLAQPLYSIP